MSDLILSLSRMARRVGVTQQWLRGEADAGTIPCLKAGNRYLFNIVAVEESLAAKAAEVPQGDGDADLLPRQNRDAIEAVDREGEA